MLRLSRCQGAWFMRQARPLKRKGGVQASRQDGLDGTVAEWKLRDRLDGWRGTVGRPDCRRPGVVETWNHKRLAVLVVVPEVIEEPEPIAAVVNPAQSPRQAARLYSQVVKHLGPDGGRPTVGK
jgi:hypothetical protein